MLCAPPPYLPPPAYALAGEELPDYTCPLTLTTNVLHKPEKESPTERCTHRAWSPAVLTLSGPLLQLTFPSSVLSLSLQAGSLGLALDYTARSHVLRLRVEGRQFLLAAGSEAQLMRLYAAIEAAIDLAAALEDREMPLCGGVPKPRGSVEVGFRSGMKKWWRERKNGIEAAWLKETLSAGLTEEDGDQRSVDRQEHDRELKTAFSAGEPPRCSASDNEKMETTEMDGKKITDSRHGWRCARVMFYNSSWRASWYFRNGQAVEVPARSRICFDELYGFGLYATTR